MGTTKSCAGGCGICDSCVARAKFLEERRLKSGVSRFSGLLYIIFIIILVALTKWIHGESVQIAFMGDINLTSDIAESIDAHGLDWSFEKVQPYLDGVDFRVANLESPAGEGGARYCPKTYYFEAKPKYLDVLTHAHMDLVSLANNHCLDYGPNVILQTERELDSRGIRHMGIVHSSSEENQPVVVKIKGQTFGFLAYCNVCPEEFAPGKSTAGVSVGTYSLVAKQIRQLRPKVDYLIVFPHWGTEYFAADKNQKKLGQIMLDAGADVVVGCHPHVLQQIVKPDDGHVIAYSLGNFLFPMHWQVALDSTILRLTFDRVDGKNIVKVNHIDVALNSHRPVPLTAYVMENERNSRDVYILEKGYQYNNNRRWPSEPPWQHQNIAGLFP